MVRFINYSQFLILSGVVLKTSMGDHSSLPTAPSVSSSPSSLPSVLPSSLPSTVPSSSPSKKVLPLDDLEGTVNDFQGKKITCEELGDSKYDDDREDICDKRDIGNKICPMTCNA